MNVFSQALSALEAVADALQAPIALCGGLAAIHFGAKVTTNDVDIVVSSADLERFLEVATHHGFELHQTSSRGWHRLKFRFAEESVDVEIVPEGEKSPRDPPDAPVNPSPMELGVVAGLGFASFDGWVQMKLIANREKDRYHLVEVLKLADERQIAEAVTRLRDLDAHYLRAFRQLLDAARAERQDSW